MQVKRFRGSSMQEALAAVKKEFGDEAVILKSEKLPRSGVFDLLKKDTIEIVAAVDVPDSKFPELAPQKVNRPLEKAPGDFTEKFLQQSKGREPLRRDSKDAMKFNASFTQLLNQKVMDEKAPVQKHKKMNRTKRAVDPTKRRGVQDRKPRSVSSTDKKVNQTKPRNTAPINKANRTHLNSGQGKKMRQSMSLVENSARSRKEGSIDSLRAEVSKLHSIITSMSKQLGPLQDLSLRDFADMPAPLAREAMALIECGVEKHIARDLVEKAGTSVPLEHSHHPPTIKEKIHEEMTKMIKTSGPIACKNGRVKVIALVGPTGVGKTTTLAKLAANSKFVFDKKVSLISADTYRMSAIEHLNTFAGIAHLPLSAVYSPSELKASLAAQQDKDLVFIDTAGRSPRDQKHLQELKKFMETAQPDEIHLVVPANIKNMDLLDVIRRFSILPIDHILISKIDETGSPGSVLNISAEVESPISYITNGQVIPDDIELANSSRLARMIVRAA